MGPHRPRRHRAGVSGVGVSGVGVAEVGISRIGVHRAGGWLAVAAIIAAGTSCGLPQSSRWDRSPSPPETITADDSSLDLDTLDLDTLDLDTVVVDRGPIVTSQAVRADVRSRDVATIVTDIGGRVERRLVAVGDVVAEGDVVMELSGPEDEGNALRIRILEAERDLAEFEGRDVAALDQQITDLRSTSRPIETVRANQSGVLSSYLVGIFDTVEPGQPVVDIGLGPDIVAMASLDCSTPVAVGDLLPATKQDDGPLAAAVDIEVLTLSDCVDDQREMTTSVPPGLATLGDGVEVDLATSTSGSGLRLPTEAIRRGRDGTFVVVVRNERWIAQTVTVGAQTDAFSEVIGRDGQLADGDVVVVLP